MFCKNCGAKLQENVRSCSQCGSIIQDVANDCSSETTPQKEKKFRHSLTGAEYVFMGNDLVIKGRYGVRFRIAVAEDRLLFEAKPSRKNKIPVILLDDILMIEKSFHMSIGNIIISILGVLLAFVGIIWGLIFPVLALIFYRESKMKIYVRNGQVLTVYSAVGDALDAFIHDINMIKEEIKNGGKKPATCDNTTCGQQLNVSDLDEEEEALENLPAFKVVDVSHAGDLDAKQCIDAISEALSWLNDGETLEHCLKVLEDNAQEHEEEWAVNTFNTALFDKVKCRVANLMSDDEKMLFYKDSGVLNIGETGFLITNKCIYTIRKKGVERLPIGDIYSIHALPVMLGSCLWYFNSNKKIELDNIVCTPTSQGIILALILILYINERKDDQKIKIYKALY